QPLDSDTRRGDFCRLQPPDPRAQRGKL
ncbi:bacterial regulatory helix-turn-helix, lysR family protein, partial [Vibrio parahaemolyticus AQ3810]